MLQVAEALMPSMNNIKGPSKTTRRSRDIFGATKSKLRSLHMRLYKWKPTFLLWKSGDSLSTKELGAYNLLLVKLLSRGGSTILLDLLHVEAEI
jgi:hypothetical protein